jgi:hypothetical protein
MGDQKYLYQTRISDHLALSPEGYLICTGCVLCRSGTQQYRMSELDESSNSDELVTVNRPVSEVTSAKFLASLPGKAWVVRHPSVGMISADNHSWSARGVVLRAYVGDEPDDDGNTLVLGDLCIHDPTAIQRVLDGERQLSVGYRYKLEQGADGGLEMRNLIANHVALVEQGRAGNAQIMDAALSWGGGVNEETILPGGEGDEPMSEGARKAVAIDDEDQIQEGKSHQELISEQVKTEDEDYIMAKTQDEETSSALCERVDKLCALLEQLLSRKAADETLVPVASLPKGDRPENPIVGDLRKLRPAVQASGDKAAIDAFNTAMIAAKSGNPAPAERLLSALDSTAPALSWGDMLAIRGRELMEGKLPSEPTDYQGVAREQRERRALDARAGEPEDFTNMMRRVGREMEKTHARRG